MAAPIKFGTDGWRGIIADDFTFANVARCAQGLADYLRAEGSAARGLVVGFDTRFASREFAETVASVAAGNGIPVQLCREPAPTPVISHEVVQRSAAGGVVITSSHNPAAWSGFKFKSAAGGSASPERHRCPGTVHRIGRRPQSRGPAPGPGRRAGAGR